MQGKEQEYKDLLDLEKETREAMLSILEDIEEQKNKIEKSHKEWMDAFDTIDAAVMLHDKSNNLTRVNQAYKDLSGAEKFKDIIGRPYFNVFPKLKKPMKTCMESIQKKSVAQEEFVHTDGRRFRSRTYPVYDENENYTHGIHIFDDITQEHKQEKYIKDLNKTLRLISKCNEILVRSQTEKELISKISNEIIEKNVYDFIGVYFKTEESIMCTHYVSTQGEIPNLKNTNFLESQYDDCPVTKCIIDNTVITINDIEHDQEWSEILKKSKEICPAFAFDMKGSIIILPLSNTEMLGAMVIYSRDTEHFDTDKINLFVELSEDTAYGIHTLRLRENFLKTSIQRDEMLLQIKESLDGTVQSIAKMVEARDPYTAGHQQRVADLAVGIAKELGLDSDTIEGLYIAAQIHDLGKIQIPSEILTKPTILTELEFEMIKTHAATGYEILKNIHFPWQVADIVHQHHEKLDGSGYPNALKGDEILLEAKILCVADIVEAIASHRPYRASLGIEFALKEIEKGRGTFYDSKVVDCCLNLFREKNYVLISAQV